MEQQKKWYMITTISGKEAKVLESLKNRVVAEQLGDVFEDFAVMLYPTLSQKEYDKLILDNNYVPKAKMKNLYPGYIFLKMDMTNEAWFIVRNTLYVTGLVGSSGQRAKPTPVPDKDLKTMKEKVAKLVEEYTKLTTTLRAGKIVPLFEVGQVVEVTEGSTKGLTGPVLSINVDKQVAMIELILFERKTPVEVELKNLKVKE